MLSMTAAIRIDGTVRSTGFAGERSCGSPPDFVYVAGQTAGIVGIPDNPLLKLRSDRRFTDKCPVTDEESGDPFLCHIVPLRETP